MGRAIDFVDGHYVVERPILLPNSAFFLRDVWVDGGKKVYSLILMVKCCLNRLFIVIQNIRLFFRFFNVAVCNNLCMKCL